MDIARLKSFPLFASLTDNELEKVADLAEPVNYPAGTPLFSTGDAPDAFYIIESGTIRIRIPPAPGKEEARIELKKGAFFGEIGLVRDRPRMADALVVMDSRLLCFHRRGFNQLMSVEPQIARKVTEAIRVRLGEYQNSLPPARRAPVDEARLLLFMSPGSQEGASFLAANMAVKLHLLTDKSVLAVDMNFGNPGLQRYLSTLANLGSYSEIFAQEQVTPGVVKHAASKLPLGVSLLAGSGTGSIAMAPHHVSQALPPTRDAYDYVLIDPGPLQDPMTAAAVQACDVAHVICECTEDSIARADQLATWLRDRGLEGRVRFILNKVPEQPEIPPETIEKVLGDDLLGTVHLSELQQKQGLGAGSPVVATHPRSQVAGEITGLTRSMVVQPAGPLQKLGKLLRWSLGFED
jgi:CRP-like cAMP-binding protein